MAKELLSPAERASHVSMCSYFDSLASEVMVSQDEPSFKVHQVAPSELSPEQLEKLALVFYAKGWHADIAPVDPEQEDSLGVRIRKSTDFAS